MGRRPHIRGTYPHRMVCAHMYRMRTSPGRGGRGGTGGCPSGPHSLQRTPSSRHHPVLWMKSREVKRLTLDCMAAQHCDPYSNLGPGVGPHTGTKERGPGQRSGLRGRGEKELRPKDQAWGRVDTGAAGRTPGALTCRRRSPRGQLRLSPTLLLLVQLRSHKGRFPGGKERVRCGSRDVAPGGLGQPRAGGTQKPKGALPEAGGGGDPGPAPLAALYRLTGPLNLDTAAGGKGALGEGKLYWGGGEPSLN